MTDSKYMYISDETYKHSGDRIDESLISRSVGKRKTHRTCNLISVFTGHSVDNQDSQASSGGQQAAQHKGGSRMIHWRWVGVVDLIQLPYFTYSADMPEHTL